ncbi:unnamed protein product, partial [marine sediment metagenome]
PISGTALDNTISEKGLFIYGAHVETAGELTQFKSDIDTIVTKINGGGLVPITVHELVPTKTATSKSLLSIEYIASDI